MKEIYTCPMDPEVVSDQPGGCPKCGMDLVRMSDHGDQSSEHEYGEHMNMEESFRLRFFASLPLVITIIVLSPNVQKWFNFSLEFKGSEFLSFLIATVIVVWAGLPFYQMAKGEIKKRAFGMMTLVSLAVLSGYLFSVSATFLFPGESLYWEISTLVLAFLLGHWLEMRAVRGASGALKELAKLIPPTAHLLKGAKTVDVETQSLKVGDRILVKPGEKIPTDGKVIDGESSVNEAMLTGESVPVHKKIGDLAMGGTINGEGSLTLEVIKTGEETVLSQMMELVKNAQQTKPSVQRLADKAANLLTFLAIFGAIITFSYWFFIDPKGAVFAATLAISVIVIACPHALGLAIPTVTTITTEIAARNGILIKDMKALEVARKVNYVVFDKTGTLTLGKFGVSEVFAYNKFSKDDVLGLAASVEYFSQHPIAEAIVEEAEKRNLRFEKAKNFKSHPGKGASGNIQGSEIFLVGSDSDASGKTLISVQKDKKEIGKIALEDMVRPESKAIIESLKKLGVKTAMLTGDSKDVAQKVAKELGIDSYFARVLPEDKVKKVRELQEKGNTVAMVGDGVNDAASLTQSHVGIAIGAGTDVAIESAGIVLIKNDPMDVVKIIKLSRVTNFKMVQNLAWAAGYNIVAMPLAGGLLFSKGILLRPEWAAILMSASSIIVVFNALLLKRVRL